MPTNLYGPGDNYHSKNSHVLPSLIKRFHEANMKDKKEVYCWGTGAPLREFLHVDDLADLLFVLENWNIKNSFAPKDKYGNKLTYLNVGTGRDISIKELAELIANLIGFKGSIYWDDSKPDGTPKKQLDTTRINNLGWYPQISLVDGIKSTIDLYTKENKNF